jgi:hypothetical protein
MLRVSGDVASFGQCFEPRFQAPLVNVALVGKALQAANSTSPHDLRDHHTVEAREPSVLAGMGVDLENT